MIMITFVGVHVIPHLCESEFLLQIPDQKHVLWMKQMKFGSTLEETRNLREKKVMLSMISHLITRAAISSKYSSSS